jgi:hypothetical protein
MGVPGEARAERQKMARRKMRVEMVTATINTVAFLIEMEREMGEAMRWYETNTPNLTTDRKEAWKAGHREGTRAALTMLRRAGVIRHADAEVEVG